MFRLRLDEGITHTGVGHEKFQTGPGVDVSVREEFVHGKFHIADVAVKIEFPLARVERQRKSGVEMLPEVIKTDAYVLLVAENGRIPVNFRSPKRNAET